MSSLINSLRAGKKQKQIEHKATQVDQNERTAASHTLLSLYYFHLSHFLFIPLSIPSGGSIHPAHSETEIDWWRAGALCWEMTTGRTHSLYCMHTYIKTKHVMYAPADPAADFFHLIHGWQQVWRDSTPLIFTCSSQPLVYCSFQPWWRQDLHPGGCSGVRLFVPN